MDVSFQVPIFGDESQVDMAFEPCQKAQTVILLFPWLAVRVADYASELARNTGAKLAQFSPKEAFDSIISAKSQRVVILLTQCENVTFATAIRSFYEELRKFLTGIVSVEIVQMGCFPLSTSTLFRPLSMLMFQSQKARAILTDATPPPMSILVCASTWPNGLLNSRDIIRAIVSIRDQYPEIPIHLWRDALLIDNNNRFFYSLSEVAEANLKILTTCFSEVSSSSLIEAVHQHAIIISDIVSCATATCLLQSPRRVLPYNPGESAELSDVDKALAAEIPTFEHPNEFLQMFEEAKNTWPNEYQTDGIKLFQKFFGNVDDDDLMSLAVSQKWTEPLPKTSEEAKLSEPDVNQWLEKTVSNILKKLPYSVAYNALAQDPPDDLEAFSVFLAKHEPQLKSISVPPQLWLTLYRKLTKEIFDAGEYFELGNSKLMLKTSHFLQQESDIFLIDHAFSFSIDCTTSELEVTLQESNMKKQWARFASLVQISLPAELNPEKKSSTEEESEDVLEMTSMLADLSKLPHRQALQLLKQQNCEIINALMAAEIETGKHHNYDKTNLDSLLQEQIQDNSPVVWQCASNLKIASDSSQENDDNATALYSVSDVPSHITIRLVPPINTPIKGKDLEVKITSRTLIVKKKGAEIAWIEGQLRHEVIADESTWEIEKGTDIVIDLAKVDQSCRWDAALQNEKRTDATLPDRAAIEAKAKAQKKFVTQLASVLQEKSQHAHFVTDSREESFAYLMDEVGMGLVSVQDANMANCAGGIFLFASLSTPMPFNVLWARKDINENEVISCAWQNTSRLA